MAKTKVHGEYLKDSVVRFTAKAGENITKGQAVYISGISGEVSTVSLADANDTAKMPAFGLAEATVSTNAEVEITSFGTLKGLDTSSFSLGDILYVDTTAGSLTNNPSGLEATKLQNIGIVQRVHATSGSIKVGGAGRTNAVPNLDDGDIFIGDSNNKAVSDSFTNVLNTEAGINSSADATAITIDSSQNVMVGTTDTFPGGGDTNTGVSLHSSGAVTASRDGDFAARFNRKTSDGEIIGLNKDGSPVGSIGTLGGDVHIGSPTGSGSALRFDGTNNIIYASNASGNARDASLDLGTSSVRFKDLYLSGKAKTAGADFSGQVQHFAGNVSTYFRADNARYGQIFMDNDAFNIKGWTGSSEPIKINAAASGGPILLQSASTTKVRIDGDGLKFNSDTAAANALDDYEEGTWTLSITTTGLAPTLTIANTTGSYTKIGRQVTATIYTASMNISGAGSGILKLSGLPFNVSNGNQFYAVPSFGHTNCFTSEAEGYAAINTNDIIVTQVNSILGNTLEVANPRYMMMTITYFTDS